MNEMYVSKYVCINIKAPCILLMWKKPYKSSSDPIIKFQPNLAYSILGEYFSTFFKWRTKPFSKGEITTKYQNTLTKLKQKSSSPGPQDQFYLILAQHIFKWRKFSVSSNQGHVLIHREMIPKTNIHPRNFKKSSSPDTLVLFHKIWHKVYLCEGYSSILLSNKRPLNSQKVCIYIFLS